MKKKIILLTLILLLLAAGVLFYRNYAISKTNDYTGFIENKMKNGPVKFDLQKGLKVEKIIKRTPFKLVMLVKWGEDKEAYVSIDNWLTRAHDRIEICPFDTSKRVVIFE